MAIDIQELRKRAILANYGMDTPDINAGIMSGGVDSYGPSNSFPSMNDAFEQPQPQGSGSKAFQGLTFKPPETPNIPDYSATPDNQAAAPHQATDAPLSSDYLSRIMEIVDQKYHPEHTNSDRLNELLSQFPNRDNYNPSVLRRIGAIASGIGIGGPAGLKVQNEILDSPYNDELAAWKERVGPYQQAASLENNQNANERQLITSLATNEVNQNKYDQQNRINEEKNQIARDKNAILQAKASGAKFDTKGSRIIVMWPDGTTEDGGPTQNWSPIELQTLKNAGSFANKVQEGTNQAAAATARKQLRLIDDKNNLYIWGENGLEPQGMAPDTPEGTLHTIGNAPKPPAPETAGNALKRRTLSLQEAYDTAPNGRKWIINDGGTYSMKPKPVPTPGWGPMHFGAVSQSDLDEWNAIAQMVYPDNPNIKTADTGPGLPANDPRVIGRPTHAPSGPFLPSGGDNQPPPPPPTGGGPMTYEQQMAGVADGTRIKALDPQGRPVTIANTKASIEEALSKHYKVGVGGK